MSLSPALKWQGDSLAPAWVYFVYKNALNNDAITEIEIPSLYDFYGKGNFNVHNGFVSLVTYYGNNITVTTSIDVTSLNEVNKENFFSIYPNPTKELLNIKVTNQSSNNQIILRDFTGRVIYSKTSNGSNLVSINTEQFSSGIYLLEVENKDNGLRETRKVVID